MGEKIRDVGLFKLGNTKVSIELNKAYSSNNKYDIHIQTEKTQISMTDGEFIKFAAALKKSKIELEREKNV